MHICAKYLQPVVMLYIDLSFLWHFWQLP